MEGDNEQWTVATVINLSVYSRGNYSFLSACLRPESRNRCVIFLCKKIISIKE